MNGRELVEWINDEDFGRKMAGAYLAGFLHGQVACESRVSEFLIPLNIHNDLSVADLIDFVINVARENPECLELDVGTFMYAVFEKKLTPGYGQ